MYGYLFDGIAVDIKNLTTKEVLKQSFSKVLLNSQQTWNEKSYL